jgi:hypothetical protein
MRTTVDIPAPTYRKLKAKATEQGCSVKELILRGVQNELRPARRRKGRIELPLVHSKEPGVMNLTNEQIYEIIPFP